VPELPEVATHLANLVRWSTGKRIVEARPPPGLRETLGVPPAEFRRRLQGRVVEGAVRRGKWMLCRLSGGGGLGLHLGMTGKIARALPGQPDPRFARAVLTLHDGTRVVFVDLRRFGKVWPVERFDELLERPEIAQVGPDALSATPAHLSRAFAATARTVKEALMDQRVLAGVGNIYAAEALFRARLHPTSPARRVAEDPAAVARLVRSLRAALAHGLAQFRPDEVPEYVEEGAPNPFWVYDRQGEPCRRCGTRLKGMTLGGRTTAFCPRCQLKATGRRRPRRRGR
jgi:formamidopyrimidine-DNA glycosylase